MNARQERGVILKDLRASESARLVQLANAPGCRAVVRRLAVLVLQQRLDHATVEHVTIADRYNREYREGRWSTNRELAGQCEDAYDRMVALAPLDRDTTDPSEHR